MRVGAVLDQEDPVLGAVGGDLLDLERDVAADVDEERRPRLVLLGGALEVGERHAQVVAVAVDELDLRARADRGQRRGHEGVGRAQHRLALDSGEVQRGQRAAGPAAQGHRRRLVVGLPRRLEAGVEIGLGPAVGVQDLVDQRMQARPIAVVEPDGKAREVRGILMRSGSGSSGHGVSAPCAPGRTGVRRRGALPTLTRSKTRPVDGRQACQTGRTVSSLRRFSSESSGPRAATVCRWQCRAL